MRQATCTDASLLSAPVPNKPVVAPYRMNELEVTLGFVLGSPRLADEPPLRRGATPLQVLVGGLRETLSHGPCLVSFSGGRDSSALLAVALDTARREGLPEPVALTLRYPGIATADESAWQELVVRHLGVAEWERVLIDPPSSEILGPVASASLRERGLLWPPALHLSAAWLQRAEGATILTGEGGDEVLGPHRAAAMHFLARTLLRRPAKLRPALLKTVAGSVAPKPLRVRAARKDLVNNGALAWLRSPLRELALTEIAELSAQEPWPAAKALRDHLNEPALLIGEANRTWLAAFYGARFVHPFLDSGFVEAVARDGGRWGYTSRTEAMSRIFGAFLPEAVITRKTKARFNEAVHGHLTRAFATNWDGTGVDRACVDVDTLRSLWLDEFVPAGTTALLQAAWLACGSPALDEAGAAQ